MMRPLRTAAALGAAVGLLVASVAHAEPPRAQPRIVNGTTVPQTSAFPAQVHVFHRSSPLGQDGFVCGGTLVSGRYVLTAAHCATTDLGGTVAASRYSLRLDTVTAFEGTQRNVSVVDRHGSYAEDPTPSNDLALLRLADPAPDTIEPLRVIGTAESGLWAPGTSATVIGWGTTEDGETSDDLRRTTLGVVSDTSCAGAWNGDGRQRFKAATMVCAAAPGTDSCTGDSGGPLMVQRNGVPVLMGVVSWGSTECADPDVPGVYARVGAPALNAWLRDRIPTVDWTAPASPTAGQAFTLSATARQPAGQPSPQSFAWDLDGDGAYDDATGASTQATLAGGARVVGVQTAYADGDRATDRDTVTVGGATAPPSTLGGGGGGGGTAQPPAATPPVTRPPTVPTAVPRPTPVAARSKISAPPRRIRSDTLRGGKLGFAFRCTMRCAVSAQIVVTRRTADRLGLSSTTLGTARTTLGSAGSARLRVKLKSDSRRRLRRATDTVVVTLKARMTAGGTTTTKTTQVRVRP